MIIQYDTYPIDRHYIAAMVNGDYSGLSDLESEMLDSWIDSLPDGHKVWEFSNPDEYQLANDIVTGVLGECVEASLYMDSGEL